MKALFCKGKFSLDSNTVYLGPTRNDEDEVRHGFSRLEPVPVLVILGWIWAQSFSDYSGIAAQPPRGQYLVVDLQSDFPERFSQYVRGKNPDWS